MKRTLATAFVLVLLVATVAPALAKDILTVNKAPIYEKPDKSSKVIGEVDENVTIPSDQTKDFWYHVTAAVNGQQLTGWMYFTDVSDMMGRSKGELLAENKRLLDQLGSVRERVKKLEEDNAAMKKALNDAGKEIERLKKALDEAKAK